MPPALRLTRLQAELLVPGLRQIYISDLEYDRHGFPRQSHPEAPRSWNPRFGTSRPEFVAIMMDLWKQIQKIRTTGGRIYLDDPFWAAACIFAVRVTMKKVRHGHHEAWSPNLEPAAKRLIARLEAERKRLKRVFINEHGKPAYQAKQMQWESFVTFLHYYYVYCRCAYRPRNNLYRRRRLVIDQLVKWTEEEIISRGAQIPGDLRVQVRRFLSYVRRDRVVCYIPQLMKDEVAAKFHLVHYVLYRYFWRP